MPRPPKLEVPYALPGAESEGTVRDRDGDVGADEGTLDMGGHVVVTLRGMPVEAGSAATVVGHDALKRLCHVRLHIRIPVFVERQPTRRVLDKEVHQPDPQW